MLQARNVHKKSYLKSVLTLGIFLFCFFSGKNAWATNTDTPLPLSDSKEESHSHNKDDFKEIFSSLDFIEFSESKEAKKHFYDSLPNETHEFVFRSLLFTDNIRKDLTSQHQKLFILYHSWKGFLG